LSNTNPTKNGVNSGGVPEGLQAVPPPLIIGNTKNGLLPYEGYEYCEKQKYTCQNSSKIS
jgi:hypothetical protein